MRIIEARDEDRLEIGSMLARAFVDDPAVTWLNPDLASREAVLPQAFAHIFDGDAAGLRLTIPGLDAATLWQRPGHADQTAGPRDAELDEVTRRAIIMQEAMHAHMPKGPFWYLHVAGCDPAAQGRGLGRALVQAGLTHTGGYPAYLETANERNVPFYTALDFQVIEEWNVPDGPKFWSMLWKG